LLEQLLLSSPSLKPLQPLWVQSFHPVENDEQSASDHGFFPSQIPEKLIKKFIENK
jgi:hypothetical protein